MNTFDTQFWREDLIDFLNRNSIDDEVGIPDDILADFLIESIRSLKKARDADQARLHEAMKEIGGTPTGG